MKTIKKRTKKKPKTGIGFYVSNNGVWHIRAFNWSDIKTIKSMDGYIDSFDSFEQAYERMSNRLRLQVKRKQSVLDSFLSLQKTSNAGTSL